MCDNSRHGLPGRLACEGELLVTHRFPTKLIGLASALDIEEAERRSANTNGHTWFSAVKRWFSSDGPAESIAPVSIPPGARLRMTHIPADLKSKFALGIVEDVLFTGTGDLDRYRDAIRFDNGTLVVLQTLPENVCFILISLGSHDTVNDWEAPVWFDNLPAPIGARGL